QSGAVAIFFAADGLTGTVVSTAAPTSVIAVVVPAQVINVSWMALDHRGGSRHKSRCDRFGVDGRRVGRKHALGDDFFAGTNDDLVSLHGFFSCSVGGVLIRRPLISSRAA